MRAAGDRQDVVLVAQSLGAFTAPLVCARAPVRMLIFVNAMIPLPGETPGAWWGNTCCRVGFEDFSSIVETHAQLAANMLSGLSRGPLAMEAAQGARARSR